VPQSPALAALKIGYLREIVEHPRPASRVDKEPKDAGIAGAQMAIDEDNAGGRFTGQDYSLDVSTVSSADKAVEAWTRALDLDPMNENARRGLRMFQQEEKDAA